MSNSHPLIKWLRERSGDESGVVILMVAGMLVFILGAAALAIDIGSFYKAQRQAQSAADAGALAASQDLPSSTVAAATDGTNYGTTNYPGSTVNVTTNYNGQPSEVKVTVNAQSPSFFGQFFGLTKANVSAYAVAGGNGSSAPAALFGYDSNCSGTGIQLNGNAEDISGAVISNGNLSQEANPSSAFGPATYGGPNGCKYTDNGKGSFSSGPTATTALASFPVDYRTSPNAPVCTVSGTSFTWSSNNKTIPSGVYCASGTITLSGNHLSGTDVTFVANSFVITGNNSSFTAPSDTNLLFWETGTSNLDIESNSIDIGGDTTSTGATIFAPSATVVFDGNSAGTGLVEAQDIIVNGNSFSLTGSGPQMGGTGNALVQ